MGEILTEKENKILDKMEEAEINKYHPFLRWLLFVTLCSLSLCAVYYMGWVHEIWENDFSKLTSAIAALTVFCTISCGMTAWSLRSFSGDERTQKSIDKNMFLASKCSALGLIGTCIGMVAVMRNISELDLANINLQTFGLSMSTALYTTAVGLIAKMFIEIQAYSNHLSTTAEQENEDSEI